MTVNIPVNFVAIEKKRVDEGHLLERRGAGLKACMTTDINCGEVEEQ